MFTSTHAKAVTMSLAAWAVGTGVAVAQETPMHKVPGVVIRYTPAKSGVYVGSPGSAVLSNGDQSEPRPSGSGRRPPASRRPKHPFGPRGAGHYG